MAQGDVIENFTEQRVLRMLYDLEQKPPGPPVDQQRVYVFGQSMGGSGALAFAQRFPNVFAAAYASQPITNYRTAGVSHEDWVADASIKWGRPELNLPVAISAPAGWARPIIKYQGKGVWDWQDYQGNLTGSKLPGRMADAMAPVGVSHGRNDHVVFWNSQGKPFYGPLNDSRQVWGGVVNSDDHQWQYFAGLPVPFSLLPKKGPFWDFGALRDETLPGLSNLSGDEAFPPEDSGTFNQTIMWSSSWDAWDGPPVDQEDLWRISLCTVTAGALRCGSDKGQTVDVTPRRLQHFTVLPGASYDWQNLKIADGKWVQGGTVVAGLDGLITIVKFAVTPGGNRLIIRPHK